MARTGRPAKPLEVKRRTGNPGKRPLPAQTVALILAPPPQDLVWELDPYDTFARLLTDGAQWLGITDSTVLALVRQGLEERKVVRARAMGGSSEARKELRELEKQLTVWLSSLGFDPAARSKLGVAEVRAQSKLEDLRAKRTKRETG